MVPVAALAPKQHKTEGPRGTTPQPTPPTSPPPPTNESKHRLGGAHKSSPNIAPSSSPYSVLGSRNSAPKAACHKDKGQNTRILESGTRQRQHGSGCSFTPKWHNPSMLHAIITSGHLPLFICPLKGGQHAASSCKNLW